MFSLLSVSLDVNECEDNNGGCSQVCVDTPASFECRCNDGFTLQSDGRSCTGIYMILSSEGTYLPNSLVQGGIFTHYHAICINT